MGSYGYTKLEAMATTIWNLKLYQEAWEATAPVHQLHGKLCTSITSGMGRYGYTKMEAMAAPNLKHQCFLFRGQLNFDGEQFKS